MQTYNERCSQARDIEARIRANTDELERDSLYAVAQHVYMTKTFADYEVRLSWNGGLGVFTVTTRNWRNGKWPVAQRQYNDLADAVNAFIVASTPFRNEEVAA